MKNKEITPNIILTCPKCIKTMDRIIEKEYPESESYVLLQAYFICTDCEICLEVMLYNDAHYESFNTFIDKKIKR